MPRNVILKLTEAPLSTNKGYHGWFLTLRFVSLSDSSPKPLNDGKIAILHRASRRL